MTECATGRPAAATALMARRGAARHRSVRDTAHSRTSQDRLTEWPELAQAGPSWPELARAGPSEPSSSSRNLFCRDRGGVVSASAVALSLSLSMCTSGPSGRSVSLAVARSGRDRAR